MKLKHQLDETLTLVARAIQQITPSEYPMIWDVLLLAYYTIETQIEVSVPDVIATEQTGAI